MVVINEIVSSAWLCYSVDTIKDNSHLTSDTHYSLNLEIWLKSNGSGLQNANVQLQAVRVYCSDFFGFYTYPNYR